MQKSSGIINSVFNTIGRVLRLPFSRKGFAGSRAYWEKRYASGGDSGAGSYGKFAAFKAEIINRFVERHKINSVIEFGCGDGNQLSLAHYPAYMGFDVSENSLERCRHMFADDATKSFHLMDAYQGQKADLALCLDVIYHLVEDGVFERYMHTLFGAARRYVVIYSSNTDVNDHGNRHVRHRKFTDWVDNHEPEWTLIEHIPNKYPFKGDYRTGSFADFYIYEKVK